ncbi:glutamic acid-rich protein [Gracilaria domingensis]|nr:glutamic acid-rich protein [Gracilaria domingensis]
MKQRIILSEKLRALGDTPREHEPMRATSILDTGAAGVAQRDRVNRPATFNREFDFQRPFYIKDGLPQHAPPSSPSTFRSERPRQSRAGIREHTEAIPSFADYRERERVYARELASYNANVDSGCPLPYRHRWPREQKNNSFCLRHLFEAFCSSKGRRILQLLCMISLIVIALHFTTTNRGVPKGSRSILHDALPWVFRATNTSAQQIRSKALWENHIVLSDDNQILIPESFESRWNVDVAPLFEDQLHRIWDELPLIQCSNDERVYAGFSMKESESLPATVSFESKCNHDPSSQPCTQQRQVADLRHLSIDLPSKSSRSSHSVTIMMKRSVEATDVKIDSDEVSAVAKGILQFHLSDSSKIALVRYCSDRRHHFSDSIVPQYTASSRVRVTSLYELKRMYALASKNRRGVSYFTELWDADELSRVTFDPVEHSWHPLTRTNWKRFRLRRHETLDERNDKATVTSSLESESVRIDRQTGSNASDSETTTNGRSTDSPRIPEIPKDAVSLNTSSLLEDTNEKNLEDSSKIPLLHDEDKSESKFFEAASQPKTDLNDERKEAQEEDDVAPDNLQDVEESEEDDDSSSENQSQDDSGERVAEETLLPNEQFRDREQEPINSGKIHSGTEAKPPFGYVTPSTGDHESSLVTGGSSATMNRLSASASHSQAETQATDDKMYHERRLPEQGHTSEYVHDSTLSQNPPSQVRGAEDQNQSQPHQFPRQREPAFPRTTQSSLASPPTGSKGVAAGIQNEHSMSTNNPQSMQTLPQSNANGLPSQGAPLYVGNTEPPLESLQSTQIPLRQTTKARADGSDLQPHGAPLRIRGRETQQESSQSSQTWPNNPQMHHIEAPLQRSSLLARNGKVQQHIHSNEDVAARAPVPPRAHRVGGVQNQLPNGKDFQRQMHSRGASEDMRDSRTVPESRASASNTQPQPYGFQEALVDRRRLPQSRIGSMRRSPESALIKTSTAQVRNT